MEQLASTETSVPGLHSLGENRNVFAHEHIDNICDGLSAVKVLSEPFHEFRLAHFRLLDRTVEAGVGFEPT